MIQLNYIFLLSLNLECFNKLIYILTTSSYLGIIIYLSYTLSIIFDLSLLTNYNAF